MLKYFRTIRKPINLILLFALFSIVTLEGWLSTIPEFVHWGSELGEFWYVLCISFVSSYIFYFFVVHIKEEQDKERLWPYIENKVEIICNGYKQLVRQMAYSAGIKMDEEYPSYKQLKNILAQIRFSGNAPMGNPLKDIQSNWLDYTFELMTKTQYEIRKIIVLPIQDTELISVIAAIDECNYFFSINMVNSHRQYMTDEMDGLADDLFEYGLLCKQLEDYLQKVLYK